MIQSNVSIPEIARMLASRAATVAKHLYSNGKKERNEWVVGSVDGEEGRSLKICISGAKAGLWADFAAGIGGDLVELWCLKFGTSKGEGLKEIREFLAISDFVLAPSVPVVAAKKEAKVVLPPSSIGEAYHRAAKERLLNSAAAIGYLKGIKRGLTDATIQHFGLGLSRPYKGVDGLTTSDAVMAPMRSREGEFLNRSAFISVPGVTQNPLDDAGWMKGAPTCYYADSIKAQTSIFVCEGLKDVWRHWQAMRDANLVDRVLLVTSTHGSAVPVEWQDPAYWAGWKYVYLGQDNDKPGEATSQRVFSYIGRPAKRIRVPEAIGKDWTDYWQKGGTIEQFVELLNNAQEAVLPQS